MKSIQKLISVAAVAIDVVIFTVREGTLQTLLIQMKESPFPRKWALPGGLVKPEESLDKAVKRHLLAKAGIADIYLEQLYTFGKVDRDPRGRVVSVAYFGLIPSAGLALKTADAYLDIQWFPVRALPALGYDHKEIIQVAHERLYAKLEYTTIVYGLLLKEFTLGELQSVYETILERKLDKRNFRKKLSLLKLVKKTGRLKRGGVHRPAQLYRFVKQSPEMVRIL